VTSARELLRPPRPWHLILAPAIPLLGFLKSSLGMVPPDVIVLPLALASGCSLILSLALAPVAADRHRSAFAASLLMLAGLSFMTVVLGAAAIGMGLAVALVYAAVAVAAFVLVRTPGSAAALTVFANRAFALAVLLLVAPIVWGEWQRPRSSVEPFALPAGAPGDRPDVYVIVLDGYARDDVMRDVYGFENGLARELRSSGFFVADRAAANYSHTALSLASALNGDYIPRLNHVSRGPADRRGLGDLINDSRFFDAFAAAGYRIRAYASEYALVRPRRADERPSPGVSLDEFSFAAYETTLLPTVLNVLGLPRGWLPMGLHRRHITWTLQHLAETEPSQPTLVFAHILAPHPPFAFDANGGARRTRMPALLSDGDMWHRIANGNGESYKSGYADTVRVLNERLLSAVRSIVARRRESIVLVHSDHGPGSALEWENPGGTDMRERMGILLAARFPKGEAPPLAASVTPVNAYRAVLNRALGTTLPALDDRSFFSTWSEPHAYIDMTARLHAAVDSPGRSVAAK
jgi:hypothetical protein